MFCFVGLFEGQPLSHQFGWWNKYIEYLVVRSMEDFTLPSKANMCQFHFGAWFTLWVKNGSYSHAGQQVVCKSWVSRPRSSRCPCTKWCYPERDLWPWKTTTSLEGIVACPNHHWPEWYCSEKIGWEICGWLRIQYVLTRQAHEALASWPSAGPARQRFHQHEHQRGQGGWQISSQLGPGVVLLVWTNEKNLMEGSRAWSKGLPVQISKTASHPFGSSRTFRRDCRHANATEKSKVATQARYNQWLRRGQHGQLLAVPRVQVKYGFFMIFLFTTPHFHNILCMSSLFLDTII